MSIIQSYMVGALLCGVLLFGVYFLIKLIQIIME